MYKLMLFLIINLVIPVIVAIEVNCFLIIDIREQGNNNVGVWDKSSTSLTAIYRRSIYNLPIYLPHGQTDEVALPMSYVTNLI